MSTPSDQRTSDGVGSLGSLLAVLADPHRRRVLYALRRDGGTTTIDRLERHLRERGEDGPTVDEIRLHHLVLPRLDERGLVDYDRRSGAVSYCGRELDTALVDWCRAHEGDGS